MKIIFIHLLLPNSDASICGAKQFYVKSLLKVPITLNGSNHYTLVSQRSVYNPTIADPSLLFRLHTKTLKFNWAQLSSTSKITSAIDK